MLGQICQLASHFVYTVNQLGSFTIFLVKLIPKETSFHHLQNLNYQSNSTAKIK